MATIGIKINLEPVSDVNKFEDEISSGSVDMYFEGFSSSILDTSDVASITVIDTPEYSNPQVDALYNQAQQTFSPAARLKVLQQLNATIMKNVAVFPLFIPSDQYLAYRPNLDLVLNQQYIGGISGMYYWQIHSTK
ncbi:MAG: hypothetical protein WDN66_03810 [Candidatus Saccharibacteria bacterium]